MKPILNEQKGKLLYLKRQLVRTHNPETRAKLIKQIKDMGLGATEEIYSGRQPPKPRQ